MMYVTAVNASCGGDTNFLAYASFCQTESSLDRSVNTYTCLYVHDV